MKLSLDHVQRLNLHVLIGMQRASVDEIRVWWRLQDRIELSDDEKKQINYRMERIGQGPAEQPTWDLSRRIPARDFEFTPDEIERVQKIFKEWQHGFAAADRPWLEPLLAQFESRVNGSVPNEAPVSARHRA